MNTIGDRICEIMYYFIGKERGNKAKFSRAVGENPNTVSNWFSRGNGIGKDVINKIILAYPNVNSNWLLTGEGEMLNRSTPKAEIQEVPTSEKRGKFFTENSNGAKFYDLGNGKYRMAVKLVPYCAYGRFANVHDTLEPDKDDWEEESFEVPQIVHGNYLSFEVKSDSMDDGTRQSFEPGDRLLVRELNRIHWVNGVRYKDYPFWVVVFDSSILIKQIIDQDLENGTLTFHSLNPSPEYCDFKLSLDEIRKLYYVIQKKPRIINY